MTLVQSQALTSKTDADRHGVSRRRALGKLGLVAGIAYAAPTLTALDRPAYAQSTPCPPGTFKGKGKGPGGCTPVR